jgi:hypothetical protein
MSQHPFASDEEADDDKFEIKQSPPTPATPLSSLIKYHLIRKVDHPAALVGTNVYSHNGTAPPLNPYNFNPFHRLFGVEFKDSLAKTLIRIISPYEYCQCWIMNNNLIVDFAKTIANIDLLESALPGNKSLAIIEATLSKLTEIRLEQSSFLDSSAPAAPATTAMSFISGATTLKLPTIESWRAVYEADEERKTIIKMLANPSTIKKAALETIDFIYRQPLRDSHIHNIDGILYIRETINIVGNDIQLQIVPPSLRNIIFTAFHANAIGDHYNLYHTFHKIRLRYFWPYMYKYVEHLITHCAGCNLGKSKSEKAQHLLTHFLSTSLG